uniref:Tubulin polyglutamylase TTLL7 n=1 Tax=Schistosoma haematobium TaxID=6185 RepID=A0A095AR35_SCHHA
MQLRYLIWSDNFLPLERIMKLKPYQRANHFPGMIEICRKDLLTKNFSRMQKAEPDEYNFMPNTWVLPQEFGYFSNYARKLYRQGCNACFIQKPANGAMGHGIRLYSNINKISGNVNDNIISVIQEYIEHPLLIDGYKCDLRVYVLVTSCDPLKIFIYNEGLVRLSAEKYVKPSEPSGDSIYRQLTNYTINKHHTQYNRSNDDISGSKRSFAFLNHYIHKIKQSNPLIIWDKIYDLIIKTLIIALPHLIHFYRISRHKSNQNYIHNHNHNSNNNKYSLKQSGYYKSKQDLTMNTKQFIYNKVNHDPKQTSMTTSTLMIKSKVDQDPTSSSSLICSNLFEILGFDILIDEQLNPWLIEKQQLSRIRQQLSLEFYEHHNCGNWHRIFPSDNSTLQTKYASLIMTSFKQFLYSNHNDILNEIKTTYLNPITEDDIYDELSKLIKKESKLKPGINVEQYLTAVWSHCVDNRDTSDNNDSDDDIDNDSSFVHTNGNSTNRIHLPNDYFIKSSMDRKMKSMSTLSTLPPSNHVSFNDANLKVNSTPASPCKFSLNENCNVTKQMTDKLSLGKKCKSLDIERNLKHANKRIQTTDYDNNSIFPVSFPRTNQNGGHDNTQLVGDDQDSMCYVDSTNKYLSCTTGSDLKKASNSKSIANIKVGKHEMNILLDVDDKFNNSKLSSSTITTTNTTNYQFIPKQICFLPIIHWNYCTLNEILPSLLNKKLNESLLIKQQLMKYIKQYENMIQNQMTLMNYYTCMNMLANELSIRIMYTNKLDQFNSNTLDKQDLLYYYNIQCFNNKRMIVYRHDELIQTIIKNCLNSMNLMKIEIKLEGDYLPNEDISKQFENGLMNKFIRGLRITRLLNRIKNRLLINHGHLFQSIIQMIPNVPVMNETIMDMPMKHLITEPLLNVEELCCKHFLRLCIESFILDHLKYLDELIKTTDNNDDSIHFKKIT